MKYLVQLSAAIFLSITMLSCSNGQDRTSDAGIAENVGVEAFITHMDGAQVLDVRTPEEWNEGIIEGAIMYNFYGDGFEDNLAKLDKEKTVAIYCLSGGRSGKAMRRMSELGFKEVYNLKGGINAWKSADKPTVKP